MNDELPQGWAHCPVEKVFRSFGGGTPNKGTPAYWNGNIPWLSSGDIKTERIHSSTEFITRTGLENSSAHLCRPGSVLVVVRSGVLKHTLPVAVLEREAAINQDIKCFDSGCSELNEWLSLALRASANDILTLNREGTTVQSVKYETLKEFDLSIPPLAEQKRIGAKLEKLLRRVVTCQQRLARIPTLLKRFRQSVLEAACSGHLSADWREENPHQTPTDRQEDEEVPFDFDLPATWSWLSSSHAFEFVTSGSRGWARYYSDAGALFIRVGNLNHDAINLDLRSIQRVSPPLSAEGRRTKVVAGDLLISITADVGMIGLVETGLEEAYINQHVALARPIGNMERRYLAYFLAAKNGGQEQFLNLQRGATKVGLGLDDIRNIWIARPPLPEQKEIVRRIESLFALADRIEARFEEGRMRVGGISQAILAKAFRGELVPTEFELAKAEGRAFESADQLLERIANNGQRKNSRRVESGNLDGKPSSDKSIGQVQKKVRGVQQNKRA
jgi:type I restriction enzyme S subunit